MHVVDGDRRSVVSGWDMYAAACAHTFAGWDLHDIDIAQDISNGIIEGLLDDLQYIVTYPMCIMFDIFTIEKRVISASSR